MPIPFARRLSAFVVAIALVSSVSNYCSFLRSNVRSLTLGSSANENGVVHINFPSVRPTEASKCHKDLSLHQLSLDAIGLTSPPGSTSFSKMRHILQSSSYFNINIKDGIFSDVCKNIETMMLSSGLQHVHEVSKDQHEEVVRTLQVETVMSNPTSTTFNMPRILLQTEQLFAVGDKFLAKLRGCNESPLCIILEFSEYHLDYYKKHELTNSVMLLPGIMIQKRLGGISGITTPLQNRTVDVAFFGAMTDRRSMFLETLKRELPDLAFIYKKSLNTDVLKSTYTDAKVCLILHAYGPHSAAELHRLSELGPFGCIPVVETWGDGLGLHHYENCGDVKFADYSNLLKTIREVLSTISTTPANQAQHSMEKRLSWWRNEVQWNSIIGAMYKNEIQ